MVEFKKYQRNKACCAASGVLILQMLVGINAILLRLVQVSGSNQQSNTTLILKGSQMTQKDKSLLNVIIAIVNVFSLFLFIFIFHKIARKLILVGGLLLMASCEYSVFCFTSTSPMENSYIFTYGLSCFFVFVFQLSIGPIAWIQVHQILEPKLAALASALNWLFNFLVLIVTILFKDQLNYLIILFSSSCILGCVFLIYYYPETNFKTKTQIHEKLVKAPISMKHTSFLTQDQIHQQDISSE